MSFKCKCRTKECIGGIVYHIKTKDGPTYNEFSKFVPLSLRACHITSKKNMFGKEDVVTQYYENKEKDVIDANYAVPVETEAESILFEAEVGGRQIRRVVKDAKRCYNGVAKATSDPVPTNKPKSNMFQTRLGNLQPGTGVKISLKYVSSLKKEYKCSPLSCKAPCPKSNHILSCPKYTPCHSNSLWNLQQSTSGKVLCPETTSKYSSSSLNASNTANDDAKSTSRLSISSWNEQETTSEGELDELVRDDEGLMPWNARPWGETGRNWGDFCRAWGEIKRPWGQYAFK